jgi:hypothetical protein
MRVIGPNRDFCEFELDPAKALRRGRVLDRMLRAAWPKPARGVFRGSFEEFRRQDEQRMRAAALRLNRA